MTETVQTLKHKFQQKFGTDPMLVRAPASVNIIGEHTDYNDGFVLATAVNREAYFAIQKSDSTYCTVIALDVSAKIEFDIATDLNPVPDGEWVNYVIGVIDQFKKRGVSFQGFNLMFTSDIPIGVGLSSSAAVECGVAFAINALFNLGLDNLALAHLAFAAENAFVGSKRSFVNHLVCCLSKKDHVFQIDCRSWAYSYYPFALSELDMVLFDTRIKLGAERAELNLRKEECKIGALAMKVIRPKIDSLRDALLIDLESTKEGINPVIYNRCKYVIEENLRVVNACQALLAIDWVFLGKLMFQTHFGLRKLYEVSCRELNVLGRLAKYEDDVIGAHMMGEGFGGCTINLIKSEKTAHVIDIFRHEYQVLAMGEFDVYKVKTANGVSSIEY